MAFDALRHGGNAAAIVIVDGEKVVLRESPFLASGKGWLRRSAIEIAADLMTQRIKRHPFLALFDGARDANASTALQTHDDGADAIAVFHERPVYPREGDQLGHAFVEVGERRCAVGASVSPFLWPCRRRPENARSIGDFWARPCRTKGGDAWQCVGGVVARDVCEQ